MSSSESIGSGNAIDDPAADALGTHPAGALQTIAAAGMPAAASIRSAATSPSSAAAVAHIAAAASIPPAAISPAAISPRSAAAVTTEILKFEISVVNDLIERRRWSDLETYLCKCVALLLATKREDIPSLHPGLVMIPREQHFFELLAAKPPQESLAFFKELIEPLKDSESKFKPLKLGSRIDLLGKGKRLIPVDEAEIQSVLSDYLQLYFPSFVEGNAEKPQGFWQFARKLTETQVDAKKAQAHYRCLSCQWVVSGAHSISELRNHLLHAGDCIACPNVTTEILERIKDYEEAGLKDAKRKLSSLSVTDGRTASSCASSNTSSKKKTKFGANMVVDAKAILARIHVLQSDCSRVAWLIQDFDAWRGNAVKLLMERKRLLVQLESVFLRRRRSHATGPFLDEKDPVLAKMDEIVSLCSSTFTMVYPPTAAPAHQSFIEALINFEDDLYELRSIYLRSEYT